MAQYDVYLNVDGPGYLLDVQAGLLDGLNTRVVVPLMPTSHAPAPADRLNPRFDVDGNHMVMVTQFMASVKTSILQTPVMSLAGDDFEITNAIDMVFQGF